MLITNSCHFPPFLNSQTLGQEWGTWQRDGPVMVVPVTPVQNLGNCEKYLSDIVDYMDIIDKLDNFPP